MTEVKPEQRMTILLAEGKSLDEAMTIIRAENKEWNEHNTAARKKYIRENAKYICKVGDFLGKKDGKVHKVFQIWKHVDGASLRPLPEVSFGVSKARLIAPHIKEIQKFVKQFG